MKNDIGSPKIDLVISMHMEKKKKKKLTLVLTKFHPLTTDKYGTITQKPTAPQLLFLLVTHFLDTLNLSVKFQEYISYGSRLITTHASGRTDILGDYSAQSES